MEAAGKASALFPNLPNTPIAQGWIVQDSSGQEDAQAGDLGVPFVQTTSDDEWLEWVGELVDDDAAASTTAVAGAV